MEPGTDRKTALVAAAQRAIAINGLEGLRLRAGAADAGIDHSTLHHHFPTKEVLLSAVVEQTIAPLRRTLPEKGTAPERCRTHLTRLADQIESDPDRFAVLAELDLRARSDERTRAVVEEVESGWRAGSATSVSLRPTSNS